MTSEVSDDVKIVHEIYGGNDILVGGNFKDDEDITGSNQFENIGANYHVVDLLTIWGRWSLCYSFC